MSSWKKVTNPSANIVQDQYVAARLAEFKRRNPALEQQLAKLLSEHPLLAHLRLKATGKEWLKVYAKINENLQAADLTINFKAESWFTTENNYASYTQMYERSMAANGGNILVSDAMNPASTRANVDDAVTFPAAWNAPAAPTHRGLRPGQQSGQRIQNQMAFGQQKPLPNNINGFGAIESENPHFNPRTKQIFAALNYGRRPHGSATPYGMCYLVLHPRLKTNAMYIAGDTFVKLNGQDRNVTSQMPYYMLAAVMAHANVDIIKDIIKSCYQGMRLPDPASHLAPFLLLEAHVFGNLPFTGNITEVCLPGEYMGSAIAANAFTFAAKHGARLTYARA